VRNQSQTTREEEDVPYNGLERIKKALIAELQDETTASWKKFQEDISELYAMSLTYKTTRSVGTESTEEVTSPDFGESVLNDATKRGSQGGVIGGVLGVFGGAVYGGILGIPLGPPGILVGILGGGVTGGSGGTVIGGATGATVGAIEGAINSQDKKYFVSTVIPEAQIAVLVVESVAITAVLASRLRGLGSHIDTSELRAYISRINTHESLENVMWRTLPEPVLREKMITLINFAEESFTNG